MGGDVRLRRFHAEGPLTQVYVVHFVRVERRAAVRRVGLHLVDEAGARVSHDACARRGSDRRRRPDAVGATRVVLSRALEAECYASSTPSTRLPPRR